MMTAKPREPIPHWGLSQERRTSGENLPHVVSIREGRPERRKPKQEAINDQVFVVKTNMGTEGTAQCTLKTQIGWLLFGIKAKLDKRGVFCKQQIEILLNFCHHV